MNIKKALHEHQLDELQKLTMSDTEVFLRDYSELHRYCPDCGEEHYTSTLTGYIVDLSDTESYQDDNTCRCKCGSVHTMHQRVNTKKELQ